MKERPILMRTENVKAILEGRKTQTRRVIKPQPSHFDKGILEALGSEAEWGSCPYGQVGDRLWLKETWYYYGGDEYLYQQNPKDVLYKAGHIADPETGMLFISKWRPSIFMPRWASRITLEITEVRVERVQEIQPLDCLQEGVMQDLINWKYDFIRLWDSINGKKYPWESNPWVWVITFKHLI